MAKLLLIYEHEVDAIITSKTTKIDDIRKIIDDLDEIEGDWRDYADTCSVYLDDTVEFFTWLKEKGYSNPEDRELIYQFYHSDISLTTLLKESCNILPEDCSIVTQWDDDNEWEYISEYDEDEYDDAMIY